MRRRAKVDANHNEIVDALRQAGFSVSSTAAIGAGFPDIAVGLRTVTGTPLNLFLEVKDGSKPPSAQKLTPDEERWQSQWRGHVAVVRTVDEALATVERYRRCRTV